MHPADFSWALGRLKNGGRVARSGWNGKGMWLSLIPASNWGLDRGVLPGPLTGLALLPWIGMKTAAGSFVPWLASQTDILADDWDVVVD